MDRIGGAKEKEVSKCTQKPQPQLSHRRGVAAALTARGGAARATARVRAGTGWQGLWRRAGALPVSRRCIAASLPERATERARKGRGERVGPSERLAGRARRVRRRGGIWLRAAACGGCAGLASVRERGSKAMATRARALSLLATAFAVAVAAARGVFAATASDGGTGTGGVPRQHIFEAPSAPDGSDALAAAGAAALSVLERKGPTACWRHARERVLASCREIEADDSLQRLLAVQLTNCHLAESGLPTHACEEGDSVLACTRAMKASNDFDVYTQFFNMATALCYYLQGVCSRVPATLPLSPRACDSPCARQYHQTNKLVCFVYVRSAPLLTTVRATRALRCALP